MGQGRDKGGESYMWHSERTVYQVLDRRLRRIRGIRPFWRGEGEKVSVRIGSMESKGGNRECDEGKVLG